MEIQVTWATCSLRHLSGCVFGKRKSRAIQIWFKYSGEKSNMSEGASKLPQTSKFLEYPNMECLHLVIQVGLTDLDVSFGLLQAFVTWGSKPTSTLKPFWSH